MSCALDPRRRRSMTMKSTENMEESRYFLGNSCSFQESYDVTLSRPDKGPGSRLL